MRKTTLSLVSLLALSSACIDTAVLDPLANFSGPDCARPDAPTPYTVPCGIAVIGREGFDTTTLSVLDPQDGTLAADGFLDSGSTVPGLTATLSGDVAAARNPNGDGELVVIDRAASTLTWIEPVTLKVRAQMSVGAANYGVNPQDALTMGNKMYVSRYDAVFDAATGIVNEGDDLAVIDLTTRKVTGRVALTDQAAAVPGTTATILARPVGLQRVDTLVYVLLQSQALDWTAQGSAVLVVVDTASDSVVKRLVLGNRRNCGMGALDPERVELIFTCGGRFLSPTQHDESALVVLDVANPLSPTVAREIPASVLGGTRVFSFEGVSLVGKGMVAVTTLDPLGTEGAAVVVRTDGSGPQVTSLLETSEYWSLSLVSDPYRSHVWVADGRADAPAVSLFAVGADGKGKLSQRATFTRGLPPTAIAAF